MNRLEETEPTSNNNGTNDEIPDIVLRLLGAGGEVGNDDLNGRESHNRYLEENIPEE